MKKQNQKGFTLIELLLVIGLIGLTVGVTGDIILSLIRSYSKTQSTTDVERAANFAVGKLEKEFKNAVSVTPFNNSTSLSFETKDSDGTTRSVTYEVLTGASCGLTGTKRCMKRTVDAGSPTFLTDTSETNIVCTGPSSSCFDELLDNPSTLQLFLRFTKMNNTTGVFSGSVDINTTVIAKGTYK